MKRIGIFYFHDDDGIVDDYIDKLLEEMGSYLERLIIICNGILSPQGRKKLGQFSTDIIVRENSGYNAEAYKEALFYLGEEIVEYEEIILFDSTILGPVFSLEEVFGTMETKDVDFWGITKIQGVKTKGGLSKYISEEYLPEYIESYFIAFRKNIFNSYEFEQYWKKLPEIRTTTASVVYFEIGFTEKFSNYGFRWDVYADDSDLTEGCNYPLMWQPTSFLEKTRCPFVKIKSFVNSQYLGYLYNGTGETTKELYDYLNKETSYDVKLIWNHVLRTNNMLDIKRSFQLEYILSSKCEEDNTNGRDCGLLIRIGTNHCLEKYVKYLKNLMTLEIDLHIICEKSVEKDIKRIMAKHNIAFFEIQHICSYYEYAKKLIDMSNIYRYICSIDFSLDGTQSIKGAEEGVIYNSVENMIKSEKYILNILHSFVKNPKLGMLVAPTPIHADYSKYVGREWGNTFRTVEKIANKMRVPFEYNKPAIAPYKGAFWCRSCALKAFKEYIEQCNEEDEIFNEGDFARSVLYVCLPIFIQNVKYYTAIVKNESYAGIEMTNMRFFLEEMKKKTSPYSDNKHLIEFLGYLDTNKTIFKK